MSEPIRKAIADVYEEHVRMQNRIVELESIIRAILDADERGQGVGYAEAMERAHKAVPRI